MRSVRLALALGVVSAFAVIAACSLDESGSFDGGGSDVANTNDASVDTNAIDVIVYDVPDLGTGETDSGLPCTCVTAIPQGYWVVEYSPNAQDNCSAGYGSHMDWTETTGNAAQCACTCAPTPQTQPTCTCGKDAVFNIASGNGNCTDVTSGQSLKADQAPACYTTTQTLSPNGNKLDNMQASQSATNECGPTGGACGGPTTTNSVPPLTTSNGRACPLDAGYGSCSNGVCVPTQGSPYALCVTNGTTAACPSGDFVVQHNVGTGYTDTRGCGPSQCSCTLYDSGTCNTPVLHLFTNGNNNCGNTQNAALPVDNATCVTTSFGNTQDFNSTTYTITADSGGACEFTGTFVADGGVSMTGGYTICCRP